MTLQQLPRIGAAGFCYTVFALGAWLPAAVSAVMLLVPCSKACKQRWVRASLRCLCLFYVKLMQWVGLYHYRVDRRNKADIRGHLVVANHPMLIDALFVMAFVPNVCCIVKPTLASNPFTRLTVRAAGFLTASDENLLAQACAALARGENLLIFPEGTRNEFDTQLEFKRGAANIAVIARCPILPVVIHCSHRVLQKGQKWYDLPDRRADIRIAIEPSLQVEQCIDASEPPTRQYRTLTGYLREFYLQRLTALA